MPDDPKPDEQTDLTDLEQIAQQIGDLESAEDIQLEENRTMLKGALDALNTIAGLLKLEWTEKPLEKGGYGGKIKGGGSYDADGKLKKADDDDDDDNDDDDDMDYDEDNDGPGYQDMDMASDYVEVTDLLEDLAKAHQIHLEANRVLVKENRRLHHRLDRLDKAVQQSRDLQVNGLEASATLNAQLVKSQAAFMERMASALHEQPMAFGQRRAPLRALHAHGAKPITDQGEQIAHTPQQTKRLLAKAMGQRILTDVQVSAYRNFGRFDADPETNQQLVADVKALAS